MRSFQFAGELARIDDYVGRPLCRVMEFSTPPSYKRSSLPWAIGLVLFLGFYALITAQVPQGQRRGSPALGILALGGVGCYMIYGHVAEKERRRAMEAKLIADGFEFNGSPSTSLDASAQSELEALVQRLSMHPSTVSWLARKAPAAETAEGLGGTLVFEHARRHGRGTIVHLVIRRSRVEELAGKPTVQMGHFQWMLGNGGLILGSAWESPLAGQLAKDWTFYGSVETAAQLARTPEFCQAVQGALAGEVWTLGDSAVVGVFETDIDPGRFDLALERFERVLAASRVVRG